MFEERPSQQKVVGVSRRYLESYDVSVELAEYVNLFTTKELKQYQAIYMGQRMAVLAISKLIRAPIQRSRRAYLRHAQEVEGYVIGEQDISVFAQRRVEEYATQE